MPKVPIASGSIPAISPIALPISLGLKSTPGANGVLAPEPIPAPLIDPTAVIVSGGAIAPGNPAAKAGLAITIAPIIIPASEISSGISTASGAASIIPAATVPFAEPA